MPPEQNTTESTPAVVATPVVTTLATEADPIVKAPDATATDPALPAKVVEEIGDVAKIETKTEDLKAEGAPEAYEVFTAPEGVTLPAPVLDAFQGAAKEAGLSQAKAQALLSSLAPVIAKQNNEAINTVHKQAVTQWLKDTKADTEVGGDKLPENLAIARRAMSDKIATPALKKLLDDSGLGNHPEVIRWMFRVGKHIMPDSKLVTGAANTGGEKTVSDTLWPTPVKTT